MIRKMLLLVLFSTNAGCFFDAESPERFLNQSVNVLKPYGREVLQEFLKLPEGIAMKLVIKKSCDKKKKYDFLRYQPTQADITEVVAKSGYETMAHCVAHILINKGRNYCFSEGERSSFEGVRAQDVVLLFAHKITRKTYYRAVCSEVHRQEGKIADFLKKFFPHDGTCAKLSDGLWKLLAHEIGAFAVHYPFDKSVNFALERCGQDLGLKFARDDRTVTDFIATIVRWFQAS